MQVFKHLTAIECCTWDLFALEKQQQARRLSQLLRFPCAFLKKSVSFFCTVVNMYLKFDGNKEKQRNVWVYLLSKCDLRFESKSIEVVQPRKTCPLFSFGTPHTYAFLCSVGITTVDMIMRQISGWSLKSSIEMATLICHQGKTKARWGVDSYRCDYEFVCRSKISPTISIDVI